MNDVATNTRPAAPTATTPGMKGIDKLTALASRYVDVEALFTHRWKLDQAEEAYKLFDTQTTGKGVFLM